MTLCIAGFSGKDNALVTVSDLLLSDQWSSVETTYAKVDPIGPANRWLAMYSGDPTVRHAVVRERMAASLEASGGDDTSRTVAAAFEATFREVLKEKIEGKILSRLGWDRETFLRRGLKYLGEDLFEKRLAKVTSARLGTDFLVGGWEKSGVFRLFSVEDPGVTHYHDTLGVHAIGAGDLMALGYLCGTYSPMMSTAELVYCLCHAKFLGESAPGVGRRTAVWIVDPIKTGDVTTFRHSAVAVKSTQPLRDVFEKQRGVLPPEGVEAAKAVMESKMKFPWSS